MLILGANFLHARQTVSSCKQRPGIFRYIHGFTFSVRAQGKHAWDLHVQLLLNMQHELPGDAASTW